MPAQINMINKLNVTEGDFKSKLNLNLDVMYILVKHCVRIYFQANVPRTDKHTNTYYQTGW